MIAPRLLDRRFTLIELLVVIAIIAVLAAMLLPVLSKAREYGKRAACMNNLKQVNLGFQSYEADFDEYVPNMCLTHNLNTGGSTMSTAVPHNAMYQLMASYVGSGSFPAKTMLNCPSSSVEPASNTSFYIWEASSYGDYCSCSTGSGFANRPFPNFRLSNMESLQKNTGCAAVVMMDRVNLRVSNGSNQTIGYDSNHAANSTGLYHMATGGNAAVLDGSVAWYNFSDATYNGFGNATAIPSACAAHTWNISGGSRIWAGPKGSKNVFQGGGNYPAFYNVLGYR